MAAIKARGFMKIFEDKYPGNAFVVEKLLSTIDSQGVTTFTGAGTSMPNLPGWGQLVADLVRDATKEGRLDENTAAALIMENSDFLYVVDEIYNAVGKAQTKAKVSKLYGSLERPTEAHKLILGAKFDRIMTLNYDHGLEMAYAEQFSRHVQSVTARQLNEVDEWLRHNPTDDAPILHWHGLAGNADSIILSGSDYVEFYDIGPTNKETLRNIFKARCVLMVGFGFSDPFIERELNSVMQPLPKANSHFAIIGVPAENPINVQAERRKYASKYKLETIFYPVPKSGNRPDHSGLNTILEEIATARPRRRTEISATGSAASTVSPTSDAPTVSHRTNLFTIGDKQIYCEPNIWTAVNDTNNLAEAKVSLTDIIAGDFHCAIVAPHEYGLSNLGRRIASDLTIAGKKAIVRDAHNLPKYRKAILSDPDFAAIASTDEFVLILDNFSVVEHQRAVRELVSMYANIRIVALQKSRFASSADDGLSELNFRLFNLRGLSRSDIRSVIHTIGPHYNSDDTSKIVDKVYSDLLQLCIPLTPSNVIMYGSVLCKDGSFSPVSRLHIVDRFVSEALQRASDAYADTFNSVDKIDLISAFCFDLFSKATPSFWEADWRAFCDHYKTHNLVEFSSTEILGDLLNGRIISKDGNAYHFRYRMFFSYFVGHHISSRPALLTSCIQENKHLELDGLVEVLCGTLPDCSEVLEDLTAKLNLSLQSFYEKYPIDGLDFHENAKWEVEKEDGELWEAVSERIEIGPAKTQDLDELKTSIQAERRTEDQKVSIIKFIASEKTVTSNAWYLATALESAKHASASSKKAAAIAVINGHTLAYEVASIFIPLIAEKKYVSWNGFTYINLIESNIDADQETNKERMQNLVAYALPSSMGGNAANYFGSRKLGQVFLALMESQSIDTSIKRYILFCLLIRSKPAGWLASATKRVGSMKRNDLYLRHVLAAALKQFREEINTEAERQNLKELIATVRLRRDVNLKSPNATQVKRAIGKLSEGGVWEVKEFEAT
ncbi:SIR2 family protein [Rhizobium cauense]|uniref:SIR2 family protein n=1 Tax=Rhizobium cauense TaxID=1166683 RepID=UPI001C6E3B72|nr:SIR2 family protein [Rhizobium cauense]MBW9117176.1 SIR2 family protein [Rhizobium cauense]